MGANPKYSLDELLASVTPENVHPETDWGGPVGRERFWEDESEPAGLALRQTQDDTIIIVAAQP
jgi:hypothetical protein